ncbi:MAG: hypothetical protein EPN93_13405 [Spirochaetes bacterium]|nr:MAG: hypothetical protein EPN93_13405 [Spirochaetota bacterium]
MIDQSRLADICAILNRHGVVYVVAGGYACALNGHVRMTEDIDILLLDETENLEKAILCIREIFPSINDEIIVADIRDNVVLKVADDIEVDFSIKAWTMDYSGAQSDIRHRVIDGVDIPFLGLDSLIKSKDTLREIDQWDVRVLREIQKRGR